MAVTNVKFSIEDRETNLTNVEFYSNDIGTGSQSVGSNTSYANTDPMPSQIQTRNKRATVVHPIPSRGSDRTQDMGKYSPSFMISGLCRSSQHANMVSQFNADQITTSYPSGRFQIVMSDYTGATTVDELCYVNFTWSYKAGSRTWIKYSIELQHGDNT